MSSRYSIQDHWCRHIPLLHQIIAGTCSHRDFPDPLDATELEDACDVWEPLHYLLKSLLGWRSPAQGLAWWYQQGQPTADSPLLRLVNQLWGGQMALDYYSAWVWQSSDPTTGETLSEGFPGRDWWEEFRSRPRPVWHDPYHGGQNALHLGHSDFNPFGGIEGQWDLPSAWELFFDEATRRVVVIVNHIGVWRDALVRVEGRLPDLGNHSWYVDIFNQQAGHLGTFRKSRVTGRWFQGKHSIHMVGNNPV